MIRFKKRFAAWLCAAAMVISTIPATPTTVKAAALKGFDSVVQDVAAEGCVLVKNENNVLPLKKGTKVSIFGRSQRHYDKYRVFAGSGEGVKVDNQYAKSILDALKDKSSGLEVNNDLVEIYKKWVERNPYKSSGDWSTRALSQPEMPLTDAQVSDARKKSDTAVVIISRLSGEDCDTSFEKGRYYLQDAEAEMLKKVSKQFDKIIVLLNITNIIDMSWVNDYGIDSVMYVWNGGQSGGQAVADIITGKKYPSGKLADTVAKTKEDYPTYENYGGKNYVNYEEDIYVGYRYFETFAPDKVQYEFGYGLSYTDFEIATNRVTEEDGYIKVVVSVTNKGKAAGKEVVQVYYGAPLNKLGNPAKELAAFAKTKELQPGESQNISLNFKISEMASYDDSGATGHESAYVLEEGNYKIYVGNSVKNCELKYTYEQDKLQVVEQLSEAAAPNNDFNIIKAVEKDGKIEKVTQKVSKGKTNVEKRLKDNLPKELQKKDNKTYKLVDVYNGKLNMEQFVAQMSNDDLASLLQGNSKGVDSYMGGSGSPFGGTVTKNGNGTTTLKKKYGIPVVTCVDGPAGSKIKEKMTLMPSGNVVGCTWNLELIEEMFRMEGKEMVANNVDNLLGPGMNIHRDPRNGRNAEYYSEDPLLTGRLAAAAAIGLQESGATATGKHMACNNQEKDRRFVDARVSERAFREIYMKPFEIFVKEGHGRAIMTAYNPVNGCYTGGNYDINTTIVRNEWKFDGMIMTDWWADLSPNAWANGNTSKDGERIWVMIRSGGDIFMITNTDLYDSKGNPCDKIKKLFEQIDKGNVTRAEMQRSAVNVLNFIIESQAFARDNNIKFDEYVKKFYKTGEDWFTVEQAELGNPQVEGISVGGREISTFNQRTMEYKVYAPADTEELPKVEAKVSGETTVEIQQATKSNRTAIVKATEGQATIQYRVVFTDEEDLEPILKDAVLANLSSIKINGKTVEGLDTNVFEYSVAVESLEKEPEIVYEVPDGVAATVKYDEKTKTVTVKTASKDQVLNYKFVLGQAPNSDEFNEDKLSNIWSIEDENDANWEMKDGHLVITAERGSLFQGENDNKNQFVQSAYGDWEAVAKLDLDKIPWTDYQSMGIVVKEDNDNYIYPKIEYSGELEITLSQEKDGVRTDLETLSKDDLEKFKDSVYFKLTKLGTTYLAAVSPDGKDYIKFAASASAEYNNPKFALVAGTGGKDVDDEIQAKFDYVHFKTTGIGDTVKIGANTTLKLADTAPAAISAALKPAVAKDGDTYITGTNEGEYIVYNVDVEKTGFYDITTPFAADTNDTQQLRVALAVDGEVVADQFSGGTGGSEEWIDFSLGQARLSAGTHKLKVEFYNSKINMKSLQFKLATAIDDVELRALVEAAKSKDMSVYPESVQKVYAEALKEAQTILATAKTQEEVDAVLAKLKEAESGLVVEGAITGITTNTENITLEVGKSAQISITVEPENHVEKVKWDSENPDVVTVDDNGTVTGVSVGTATIVASAANGAQVKITVTVKETNGGNTQPGGSNEGDVNLPNEGEGEGSGNTNGDGNTDISDGQPGENKPQPGTDIGNNETGNNNSGTGTNQTPDTSTNASQNGSTVNYMKDVVVKLKKTTLYYGGNSGKTTGVDIELPLGAKLESVKYTTNKSKTVKVSNSGKITAKEKGTAKIIVNVTLTNGETKDFSFNVKVKKAYIKKVTVPSSLAVGKSKTLKAKAYGSSKSITWKIKSGAKYAKITKKGKLTAMAKGTAKVTATSGKVKATFKIKIK